MTCFVNHLNKKGYFAELGIIVTKDNAKAVEEVIAKAVGRQGEHCPEIWKEMKTHLSDPDKKASLERELKRRFGGARRK